MTAPEKALVDELRERADASFRPDGKSQRFNYTARDAELDRRSADALEAQDRELTAARAEIERLREALGANVKRADRYGVALMMINAGCSDPARFAGAILDDREPVNVELDEEDFDENHR